jgi:hypothetical protein
MSQGPYAVATEHCSLEVSVDPTGGLIPPWILLGYGRRVSRDTGNRAVGLPMHRAWDRKIARNLRTHGSRTGRVSDSASLRGYRRARLVGRLGALDPIAACVLGSVHRLIRGVNQPVHVGAVIRIRANPDREGDPAQD